MQDSQTKQTAFQVEEVDHIELFVPDRYEAARWYEHVLGLKVVAELEHWANNPHGPLMIAPESGQTKLALFAGVPQGEKPTAGFHLVAFRVSADRFVEFLHRLERNELNLKSNNGHRLTRADAQDHGKAWSLYFQDPYGHRLELTTYDYQQARKSLADRDNSGS